MIRSICSPQIKVLIVDDNDLVVHAFVKFLNIINNITIVGVCFDGNEVMPFIQNNDVDLIFMDITMKKTDGFSTIKMVKSFDPGIKIIGFSVKDHIHIIDDIKKAGADGFISKYSITKELLETELSTVFGYKFAK